MRGSIFKVSQPSKDLGSVGKIGTNWKYKFFINLS